MSKMAPINAKTEILIHLKDSNTEIQERSLLQLIQMVPTQHGETGIITTEILDNNDINTINLVIDVEESKLPASDPYNWQTAIGIGCTLQYIEEAVKALGWKYEIDEIDEYDIFPAYNIRIEKVKGDRNEKRLSTLIERRTIGGIHGNEDISNTIDKIIAEVGDIGKIITEPVTISNMSELAYRGINDKFLDPEFLREMFLSLVASDEISDAVSGMDPRRFFMAGKPMPLLPRFMLNIMSKLSTSKITGQFIQKMLAKEQKEEVASTSAYLVISGRNDNLQSFIDAGKSFIKFWLKAWEEGLMVQPTQVFCEAESANKGLQDLLKLDKEQILITARIGYRGDKTVPIPPKQLF